MGNAASKSRLHMEQRERTYTEHRKLGTLAMNLVREEFNRGIQEVYDLSSGKLLGKGGFGTVRVVTHKATKQKFALKTIELKDVETHEQYEFLLNEIEIMKKLDHPNIVRVQEVFHTPDHYYMVMDLCTGGDLFSRYKLRSEEDAAKIVGKLINALRYCHDRNVAHRDIKLENICFESMADDAEVKLVDFGLSAHFNEGQLLHDLVGSWMFMAPEVLQRAHRPKACDLWSMGVITYCLFARYPPFRSPNLDGIKKQILCSPVLFDDEVWDSVSDNAKDFIKWLLTKDPDKRPTAQQAQQHPWLSDRTRRGGRNPILSPGVVDNLIQFKNLNLMKRVALGVVARTLEASEMQDLEQEFHKVDRNQTGVISIDDFHQTLARTNRFNQSEIEDIFSFVDMNSSGELSYTDFTAAALDLQSLDTRRLKYAFERLDHDNNGELDYEDLLMTVGSDLTTEQVRTAIKQFDTKGNGRVTFEDFCKGMRSAGGSGALDALSTAQLTSGYMVESIANGEGAAAIEEVVTELERSPPLVVGVADAHQQLANGPESIVERLSFPRTNSRIDCTATGSAAESTAQLPSTTLLAGGHGERAVSLSSTETGPLSRPQSIEQWVTAPALVGGGVGRTGSVAGGDTSAGGGPEAALPNSEERVTTGGPRAEATPSSGDRGGRSAEGRVGEGPGASSWQGWGDLARGSLADRRMRDSLKIRGGLGTPTGGGGLMAMLQLHSTSPTIRNSFLTGGGIGGGADAGAVAARTGAARQSHSPSGAPYAPADGGLGTKDASLLPPLPSKNTLATRIAPAQAAPASAQSGGEPAAAVEGGGRAESRNGSKGASVPQRKAAEEDLPPKDSTAESADLGWGPDGPPADMLLAGSMSGGSSGGSGNGSGSRTPKSQQNLRFGGVSGEGKGSGKARKRVKQKGKGGLFGIGGSRRGREETAETDGLYANYDSISLEDDASGGAMRKKRMGTFCLPQGGDGELHLPGWLMWLGAILNGSEEQGRRTSERNR